MIKIVQIQYSTNSGAKCALRLQHAFKQEGLQSHIVSLEDDFPPLNGITYLGKKEKLIARISMRLQQRLTKNTVKQFGLFSYPVLSNNIAANQKIQEADIIYVHWVMNGFLNTKNLEQLLKLGKPVIFVLHDMWFITGGCHYSFDCKKYETACHNCQMFSEEKDNDLAAKGFAKKKELYSKYPNLYFVSPGKWLQESGAAAAVTKGRQVYHIPNILNPEIYKPADKVVTKKMLGIQPNETVIAFGAVSVTSPYKGWSYLQKALELYKQKRGAENIVVLIFGSESNDAMAAAIPFKTKFMGYLKDEYSAAIVYNAADVFIAPSLQEVFGYVIMEALCCGTPVVGFNTGGIPDMIRHKKNGYLAEYKNAEDLMEGIDYCLQNKISGFLPEEIEPKASIQKHIELINAIIK